MNRTRFMLNTLAAFTIIFACSVLAQAQATRTWVSGVGDDLNLCSRTAPCRTFAGALSKTAAGGEIDALDPGGYGTFTITKSMTIDGNGTLASVLLAGDSGINVNVQSTDTVILRNLSINGAGTGVNGINWTNAGGNLTVENVDIDRVTGSGIFVNLASSGNLRVSNTRINNCGSINNTDAAIRITTSAGQVNATISDTNMTGNRVGVNVGERSQVLVRDSVASGYVATGAPVGFNIGGSTGSSLFLENCTATHNNSGVRGSGAGGLQTVFLSNCSIFHNTTGVNLVAATQAITYGNNRITGNTADFVGALITSSPGQR